MAIGVLRSLLFWRRWNSCLYTRDPGNTHEQDENQQENSEQRH